MAMNTAALNAAAQGFATAFPFISLHSAGAVTSSASETSASRVSAGWTVSNGVATASNLSFSGVAANGAVVRVGYWSASTAGTYGGGSLVSGDQSANSAGSYSVTSITETGTAS